MEGGAGAGVDAIPALGETLAGKYRIDGILGRGGMGVVLAAYHLHLEERVAIKFLLPELAREGPLVVRFLREGRAAIKIRSEHVVRILDVEALPGGTPYMVMEYLDGTDLADLLEKDGKLPVAAACDHLLQATEALAEAHALGMVHRDLKPSNLFLVRRADDSACIKVLDFGITKYGASTGPDLGMTHTNAVMGSPRYMSPEQMRSSRTVDPRSDVWALGIILHELLAGAPPFDGTTMPELLVKVLEEDPPPLSQVRPDVPAGLQKVIARCLQKDPAARYPDVGELARALVPFGTASARASADRATRILSTNRAAGRAGAPPSEPASAPAVTGNGWARTGKPLRPSGKAFVVLALGVVACGAALLFFGARSPRSTSIGPPPAAATTPVAASSMALSSAAASAIPSAAPAASAPSAASSAPSAPIPSPRTRKSSPATGHPGAPGHPPAPTPTPQGNDLFSGRQ